jgi:uncharacterized protein
VKRTLLAMSAAAALAVPAAAEAHVTLQPDTAPAGQFTRLDVRVPTEGPRATRKVVLQLPPGFLFASYQPTPGWTVRMTTRKLAHAATTRDGTVDREVSRISWTANSAADAIPPGGFQDFGLSVGMPEGAVGTKLTFKALQHYADGEVVRWIGPADSETPAPQVTLREPAPAPVAAASDARAEATAADAREEDQPPSRQLVLAALAAAGFGVLMGFMGLLSGARRS